MIHRSLLRLWMLLAIAALLLSAFAASIRGLPSVADVPLWDRQPDSQPAMVAEIPHWSDQFKA